MLVRDESHARRPEGREPTVADRQVARAIAGDLPRGGARTERSIGRFRRWGSVAVGLVLLVVGAALLGLPGPGLLVIFAGLTLLAAEFPWARRLAVAVRNRATRALVASDATPLRRALTLLSEVTMAAIGVAIVVLPGVGLPLWGWTTGVLLLLSGPVSFAIRSRYRRSDYGLAVPLGGVRQLVQPPTVAEADPVR